MVIIVLAGLLIVTIGHRLRAIFPMLGLLTSAVAPKVYLSYFYTGSVQSGLFSNQDYVIA